MFTDFFLLTILTLNNFVGPSVTLAKKNEIKYPAFILLHIILGALQNSPRNFRIPHTLRSKTVSALSAFPALSPQRKEMM